MAKAKKVKVQAESTSNMDDTLVMDAEATSNLDKPTSNLDDTLVMDLTTAVDEIGAQCAELVDAQQEAPQQPSAPVLVEVQTKLGIGKQIRAMILAGGLTNTQMLVKVLADNPGCKTTYACVAWYKSNMRKAGLIK